MSTACSASAPCWTFAQTDLYYPLGGTINSNVTDRKFPLMPLLQFGASSRLNLLTTRLGAVQGLRDEFWATYKTIDSAAQQLGQKSHT